MKLFCTLFIVLFIQGKLLAQNKRDRAFIINHSNVERLNQISSEYLKIQNQFKNKAVQKVVIEENGNMKFFSHFDHTGDPIYYLLDNESSAISSKIDRITTGGSTGLDLDGTNIEFGLWDGGSPRVTHQEFDSNITIVDNAAVSGHATHIAGILTATGIVPQAKGMAPAATIASYTSSNWASEVPLWAAGGGMISSHSYVIANPGANYQLYGIYNQHSQSWDDISYNAPYLIMCTGASNNGNNNYNPNGSRYDLLASNKLGKNSIVIGACSDVLNYIGPNSVNQAAFTSWGPTDDWRIKPDITAVGTNSYSTREASDMSYGTGQGSSFAAPIVSGGLALLQQHYHNLNFVYMKATTAKALILSTTDEAGLNDGPDFSNGWGLFNAEKAAEVISNNGITSFISELTLNQNGTYSLGIEVDGTGPLSVAICWNDPAATPLAGQHHNDSTLMLINDLDLRVASATSLYYPWVMVPNQTYDNYTVAASKGDNFRDNVEIINIDSIGAGVYTVTVNHKGNLQSGAQDFSLIINGVKANSLSDLTIDADKERFAVFPNPTNQVLNIEFNSKEYEELIVTIYSLNGQKQLGTQVINQSTNKINVSELAKGIYMVKIQDKNSNVVSTKKIMVH